MTDRIFSVSEISAYIKTLFSRDYVLSHITVSGEISNCKYTAQGHIFFSLKDDGAVLSCIMFATERSGLSFHLEDGKQVEVTGQIAVYEKTGRYQLYAKKCSLVGEGKLYDRYLKLKASMEEMGMFDKLYKKPIPPFCMSVGIVTAATGAAVQDIINVSTRRNPYVQLTLYPALVQGDGAAHSISRGISTLDALGLDVIIVGRGGGSIEDLWAFNEPIVAESIFDAKTPIISAVGHETDFTIADFVADLRAPTPSAAAEMANFIYSNLEQQIDSLVSSMEAALTRKLQFLKTRVTSCSKHLYLSAPESMLSSRKERAYMIFSSMSRLILSKLGRIRQSLRVFSTRMDGHMDAKLKIASARAVHLSSCLEPGMQNKLGIAKDKLKLVSASLEANSPLKRMSGGYGYLLNQSSRSVRSVKDVKKGEDLSVYLRDGKIETYVKGTKTIRLFKN